MRRLTASTLLATALAAAGCAGMQPPPGDNAYCAQLFDQYDSIVTNMADEARSLAFFQALGYRARTVGAPDLGTRVYVEARSLGDIQNIVSIATNAGFIGPYPSRYVTF